MVVNGILSMLLSILATISVFGFYHSFKIEQDAVFWRVIFGVASVVLISIPLIIKKRRGSK